MILRDFQKKKNSALNNTTLEEDKKEKTNLLDKINADSIVGEDLSASLVMDNKRKSKIGRKSVL